MAGAGRRHLSDGGGEEMRSRQRSGTRQRAMMQTQVLALSPARGVQPRPALWLEEAITVTANYSLSSQPTTDLGGMAWANQFALGRDLVPP